MEIQQIRYFLAAARELNFTRAAAKCSVTQPSLTRAINLLETELGGDLFRRERNLTHLTDLGLRMLPLMQQCINNADQALRLAKAIRTSAVASLHLGLRDSIPLEPFVPHLTELGGAFAEFDFRISRGAPTDLETQLREGKLEILLGPRPENGWDRYEHWPLYRCGYSIVFRADHPLARRDRVSLHDLDDVNLLHRPDCIASTQLRERLMGDGIKLRPAPAFVRDDDLMSYLAATMAVAFIPTVSHLRNPLVRRALDGPDFGFDIHATTVSGRRRGPALNLFLTQLRAANWNSEAA